MSSKILLLVLVWGVPAAMILISAIAMAWGHRDFDPAPIVYTVDLFESLHDLDEW